MVKNPPDILATAVEIKEGMVHLHLSDGSIHAFPVHYYPRLRHATEGDLKAVQLRVGGRALRWDRLDEDIWVADAVCQKYPGNHLSPAVAETSGPFNGDHKG